MLTQKKQNEKWARKNKATKRMKKNLGKIWVNHRDQSEIDFNEFRCELQKGRR